MFFFFKQKTAYEMRISGWSSDVCSSDLGPFGMPHQVREAGEDLVVGAGDRHPAAVAGLEMAVRTAVERARPHAPADKIGRAFVEGKSVSVRVDRDGHRLLEKNNIRDINDHR